MVYEAQKDQLAKGSPVPLKNKHIIPNANQLLDICEAMRVVEEEDPEDPHLIVSPSHVAITTRCFIQPVLVEFDGSADLTQGQIKKAIKKLLGRLNPFSSECTFRLTPSTAERTMGRP